MPEQDRSARDGSNDQSATPCRGRFCTEEAKPVLFSEWAKQYLGLEEVKGLRSYQDRVEIVGRQLEKSIESRTDTHRNNLLRR